jgi:TonB family protein
MNSPTLFDELDQAIGQMMSEPDAPRPNVRAEIADLLDVAIDLRHLPRPDFKMRLKAELEWQNWSPAEGAGLETPLLHRAFTRKPGVAETDLMPSLSGNGYGIYPVRRANFAASVLLHVAAVVVFVALGVMMVQKQQKDRNQTLSVVTLLAPYKNGGGGGGGDRSIQPASEGGRPKTSMQQLVPPVVIRPREDSKIMAEPTVVADLKLAASPQVGDQLSRLMAPSNGPGAGGGIGSGSDGGVGPGHGVGSGPGNDYGNGGARAESGHITKPKLIFSVDPEFSEEARRLKYQGVVVVTVLVGVDGRIHDARITRSLGMGLDEKALETIKLWKFEPARASNGSPVAVYASIEVNFRLY